MLGADFVCQTTERPSPSQGARYEYRVWPAPEDPVVSKLHADWPFAAAERRSDTHLLGPNPDRVLVKLRGGRRPEITARERDLGTLQLWSMPVSPGCSLAAATRDALAAALGLRTRLDAEIGRSPARAEHTCAG